jgi:hypothetical protein
VRKKQRAGRSGLRFKPAKGVGLIRVRASKLSLALTLTLLVVFSSSPALAGAFGVALDSPAAGASLPAGEAKFVFTAGGKSPLSCVLVIDGSVAANATAQKNLPVTVKAVLNGASGPGAGAVARAWRVSCVDADGAFGESEERAVLVKPVATPAPTQPVQGAQSSPSPTSSPSSSSPPYSPSLPSSGEQQQPKQDFAGSLSGFVVSRGGEREENALMASWRSSPGRAVEFAALFSNDGSKALTVWLRVTVSSGNASNSSVELIESSRVLIQSGEERVLSASWTPRAEGNYLVEAAGVAQETDAGLGKAFLQVGVARAANADWLFVVAIACVALTLVAAFKTRANASAIRGSSLKKKR